MSEEPVLNVERQIKYWQRCLKSLLPTVYTSTDSSRTSLAFFTLSALDLLGAGAETFSLQQKDDIRQWLLKCQHPHGGFCGSPNHRYPDESYGPNVKDPPNLEATFFAILGLGFVGGLDRVRRLECLRWLRTLQRDDGSFGELVGAESGEIEGGRDTRHCLCAMSIWKLLRGDLAVERGECGDVDVDALVEHIRRGETYDGGLSESSSNESHAGYTYCGIGALSLVDRLPVPSKKDSGGSETTGNDVKRGLTDLPATIRWLVARQIAYIESDEESPQSEPEDPLKDQRGRMVGIYTDKPSSASELPPLENLSLRHLEDELVVGYNGRWNKPVDTCYCWWVVGALDMLGKAHLVDQPGVRRFLLQKTQHAIGGFGKSPGQPPDIYHSYLALTTLALLKEPGLKPVDSELCVGQEARANIQKQVEQMLQRKAPVFRNGSLFYVDEEEAKDEGKWDRKKPGWYALVEETLKKREAESERVETRG